MGGESGTILGTTVILSVLHKERDMGYQKAEMSGTKLGTNIGYLLRYPKVI